MHLEPMYINMYTTARRYAETEQFHVTNCIECGCCAYTCPASVPLVLGFRAGKQMIRNTAAREKAKA